MSFDTGRPVTMAAHGMVCSPHALASQAGLDVLLAGGSAVDAAIATAAALAVIYPHMTSVGGDAFWLIHDAARNKVRYLDGGGRAASRGRIDAFHARGLQQIPFRGILPATVTTPGAVASWCEAHAAYGRLPMQRNLQDAIGYARDGFPVTARLSRWIAASVDELKQHPDSARIFLPNGQPPVAGSLLANPDLARTLIALAEGGQAAFYGGDTGRRLAAFSQSHSGFFDEQDLAVQTARWGEPLRGSYRDLTLYQTPAPTQGFTVLQMLKLLEPFELHTKEFMSADLVHLMVQAKQLAYHDRDRWLADPLFADVPMKRLLSNAYIDQRRTLMDPAQALPWDRVPSYGSLKGDTVYIGVVDKDGNAVSLIQSLYAIFGSAVVAGDTGVVLQNRGAYFSLDPESPNCLHPGKTPQHTLIASIGFRNDKLWSVMGCMGADGQPQIHLQTYVGMLDHGLDIQEAIEAPRWLSGRFSLGEARDTLNIEGRFPPATIDELARRNHVVQRWGPWNELAGHAHGITIDPVSGVRMGGSDPRSDGAAVGH
ncbi:gamma-glutamyltransferase [Variovorax sp. N23]|uniref:gamma-glutamyltransferase n=1 Tax=Variovorax sp. N23 TaxID=2980555 RepID=UPI0021C9D104|nr:gamma-glutamyltransferase [Variovorax sp. N23]MCU4120422.1 gamma-glutamyltransferase [Variovorax sp. N23]